MGMCDGICCARPNPPTPRQSSRGCDGRACSTLFGLKARASSTLATHRSSAVRQRCPGWRQHHARRHALLPLLRPHQVLHPPRVPHACTGLHVGRPLPRPHPTHLACLHLCHLGRVAHGDVVALRAHHVLHARLHAHPGLHVLHPRLHVHARLPLPRHTEGTSDTWGGSCGPPERLREGADEALRVENNDVERGRRGSAPLTEPPRVAAPGRCSHPAPCRVPLPPPSAPEAALPEAVWRQEARPPWVRRTTARTPWRRRRE